MKKWLTEIRAIDPLTGDIKKWGGPEVPGLSHHDAQQYCFNNGLGYCMVVGELIAEIPCKKGTHEPDFNNMVDYETTGLN